MQFLIFGSVFVILNTLVDIVIAYSAGGLRATLVERAHVLVERDCVLKNLQRTSGLVLCSLGNGLIFARRPACPRPIQVRKPSHLDLLR